MSYRAVLLVHCDSPEDLIAVREILKQTSERIESDTDGATVQAFGPTSDVRITDLHKIADEMFGDQASPKTVETQEPRQAGPYPLPHAIREGHHE
jgi:hypothetical protein